MASREKNKMVRNKTKPRPGFVNWGLAAGALGPKGKKVIVGTSLAGA